MMELAAARAAANAAKEAALATQKTQADYTQKPTPGTALSAMPPFHRPRAAVVTTDPLAL